MNSCLAVPGFQEDQSRHVVAPWRRGAHARAVMQVDFSAVRFERSCSGARLVGRAVSEDLRLRGGVSPVSISAVSPPQEERARLRP
jgi:hypothetical protein